MKNNYIIFQRLGLIKSFVVGFINFHLFSRDIFIWVYFTLKAMVDKKEVSSFNFRPSHKLPKITELLSYVFIDFLKLECFDLKSLVS